MNVSDSSGKNSLRAIHEKDYPSSVLANKNEEDIIWRGGHLKTR